MTLDIRGSLKNTTINRSLFAVFDELLANAIDSFLIRRSREPTSPALSVNFCVNFYDKELIGPAYDMSVTCSDNGAGLGNAETKAFVTKDTTFKDDLAILGLGECKGSGRIQFFHYFSRFSLRSIFSLNGVFWERSLRIDETTKEIDEDSFATESVTDSATGTTITLDAIKPDLYRKLFANKNLRDEFSALEIRRHLLVAFLHRLVGVKEFLGDFLVTVKTTYNELSDEECIRCADLPEVSEKRRVAIPYDAGVDLRAENFDVSHYRLNSTEYDLPRNVVALCANASPVQLITRRYLRTATLENNPLGGSYHLVLIEAPYLNRLVNEQRDGFRIPLQAETDASLFDPVLSLDEIFDVIDPEVMDLLAPPGWNREELVRAVEEKYGISAALLASVDVRVRHGDSEESVAKRVLRALGEKAVQETSELFDLKNEIAKMSPASSDFRNRVNELAWKYTASLKAVNMANLSQLVVRRAAIIEVLGMAIRSELGVQRDVRRREDERIIHNIFFPMGKDSKEVSDHDIWLLSEEYQYYDYVASDKSLATIELQQGELLFDSDVDEVLQRVLERRAEENHGKRPDIALFCKEGSAIIIEFKAPGVGLDDHVNDLMEYSQLLAAKSKGRLKKFYGYLIGSTLNRLRIRGYQRFPNGAGYFSTEAIVEPESGRPLGELYSEILFYEDLERKARMRLQVYKERLGMRLG